MKKLSTILWQFFFGILPLVYLLSVWDTLPERVPTHFNANFIADGYGSKFSLVGILIFMLVISIGTSLLILNISKIDPKQPYSDGSSLIIKISWTLAIFMALLSLAIVYTSVHYTENKANGFSPKYILALIALLFVLLGNFMNNIKPNYFIGIRTPWTLDSEDTWKKTHHLAAKIWFFGGLILFISILLAPIHFASYILTFGLVPLVLIPVVYSYQLFKKSKNKIS